MTSIGRPSAPLALLLSACFGLGCGTGSATPASPEAAASTSPNKAVRTCLESAKAKRERRRDEPQTISVKHVLVRYTGAKNAPKSLKRSREDACMRALEARGALEQGADFDGAIREYSEEGGPSERRGTLQNIQRTDVDRPFADAAFELEVNQVSAVVETDYGFHVIIRTE